MFLQHSDNLQLSGISRDSYIIAKFTNFAASMNATPAAKPINVAFMIVLFLLDFSCSDSLLIFSALLNLDYVVSM